MPCPNSGRRDFPNRCSGNLAAVLRDAEAQKTGASIRPLGNWKDQKSPDDDDLVQIGWLRASRDLGVQIRQALDAVEKG
jgi:hypothetical protein